MSEKKGMIQEFKEFINRGNVVDMAVGVMIASAFGAIVTSLVNDIIMPCISVLTGGVDFSAWKVLLHENAADPTLSVYLNYGSLIQTILNFILIAICIFFLVKAINKAKKPKEEAPAAPAEPSDETKALREIVSLLKEKK